MSSRRTNGRANATRQQRTTSRTERDKGSVALSGTTISFTSPGTIGDSGNGLAIFAVGQRIEVRGSARNSRVFTVATSAADALTVVPAVVTTESAGAPIHIQTPE